MDDFIDLAALFCGQPYDDYDAFQVEDQLVEDHQIDLATFSEIAAKLLRFTMPVKGALTGDPFHVFGFQDNDAFLSVVKTKATI